MFTLLVIAETAFVILVACQIISQNRISQGGYTTWAIVGVMAVANIVILACTGFAIVSVISKLQLFEL